MNKALIFLISVDAFWHGIFACTYSAAGFDFSPPGTYISIDTLVKQSLDMAEKPDIDKMVAYLRTRRNYMVQAEVRLALVWGSGRARVISYHGSLGLNITDKFDFCAL